MSETVQQAYEQSIDSSDHVAMPPKRRGGRLVRRYFFVSVLLIGGGLITSGLLEIYFRYRETRENLGQLQHEVTAAAAFKIERFVQEIHNTLKAATRGREIAHQGLTQDYKAELEKLLLIAPAITEAVISVSPSARVLPGRSTARQRPPTGGLPRRGQVGYRCPSP